MGERDKQAFIDDSLEKILRAAGSSLRHYMPASRDDLRKAMQEVIAAARTQGSE